jgi:hypothetical protein
LCGKKVSTGIFVCFLVLDSKKKNFFLKSPVLL